MMQEMTRIETISKEIDAMLRRVADSVDSVNAMVQELNSLTQL